jgi:hypothetical protein
MKVEIELNTAKSLLLLLPRVQIQGQEARDFMIIVQELTAAVREAEAPPPLPD